MKGGLRKEAITAAVLPAFAAKGFEGVTTKELAKAAGVSEALIYKHFPSKEALYECIRTCHMKQVMSEEVRRVYEMKPSTEKLVVGIALMIKTILKTDVNLLRLFSRSLLEDGSFARKFCNDPWAEYPGMFADCYEAARKAGDLDEPALPAGELTFWLPEHVGLAACLFALPKDRVIDYGIARTKLEDPATLFCLRGVGLKEAAIRRYYRR